MYAPFSGDNANTLPPIVSFELALCFHEIRKLIFRDLLDVHPMTSARALLCGRIYQAAVNCLGLS
jgi:hypothetical protein